MKQKRIIADIIRGQSSAVVRAYSRIRFLILRQPFLDEIGQYLPKTGRVLDLGCGFGLFTQYFGLMEPGRKLTGVDLNGRRIEMARKCAADIGVENVDYQVEDAVNWDGEGLYDAIYMLDLVHHLPRAEVPAFLGKATQRLRPGGMMILKDVADRPHLKRLFTLAVDRLMVGLEPIYYWPPLELTKVLEELGFDVKRHLMRDYLPYPHVLYVCRLRDDV